MDIKSAFIIGVAINFLAASGAIAADSPCKPLSLSITYPKENSIIEGPDTLVAGTVSGGGEEIGVVVAIDARIEDLMEQGLTIQPDAMGKINPQDPLPPEILQMFSKAAHVHQNRFAASEVPLLEAGKKTALLAMATDSCGQTARASVSVTGSAMNDDMVLSVHPGGGTFPLSVSMDMIFNGRSKKYEWDYDGDGTIDQSGPDLSKIKTVYEKEGLYIPTVTVTDDKSRRYQKQTVIHAFSKETITALLLKKWHGMRDALKNKDAEKAVSYFAGGRKELFLKNFSEMKEAMPMMGSDLGDPSLVRFGENYAIFNLVAERDGKTFSYEVQFVKDFDGLWKIQSF